MGKKTIKHIKFNKHQPSFLNRMFIYRTKICIRSYQKLMQKINPNRLKDTKTKKPQLICRLWLGVSCQNPQNISLRIWTIRIQLSLLRQRSAKMWISKHNYPDRKRTHLQRILILLQIISVIMISSSLRMPLMLTSGTVLEERSGIEEAYSRVTVTMTLMNMSGKENQTSSQILKKAWLISESRP